MSDVLEDLELDMQLDLTVNFECESEEQHKIWGVPCSHKATYNFQHTKSKGRPAFQKMICENGAKYLFHILPSPCYHHNRPVWECVALFAL